MKKLLVILITGVILSLPIASFAETQYGFQDIPFGTSYDDAKSILQKKYRSGSTKVVLVDETFISLRDFKLGSKLFTIFLGFNTDRKFEAFHFDGQYQGVDKLEFAIQDDLDYLKEVFTNKYGKPSVCDNVDIKKIGSASQIICAWDNDKLIIATKVSFSDFQYHAGGSVASKAMVYSRIDKKTKEQTQGAKEGAKAF